MPYYIFCSRCNADGSYSHVDRKCNKCSGTGNDWRDDKELESYHARSEISLGELKKDGFSISADGVKFFYKDTIPPIREERSKVLGFKKISTDISKEYEENARKDFEARIGFFTKNFYLEEGIYSHAQSYKGVFDKVSLSISFVGVDADALKSLKESINNYNGHGLKKKHNETIEVVQSHAGSRDSFGLMELIAHEFFHLLQFLDCKSVNTFYRATRKHHILRAHLLSTVVRLGVVSSGKTSLFSSILRIGDKKTQSFFMDVIKNARMESLIFKNFFLYKSKKTELNIIDILEGSALAFQKIANRTERTGSTFDDVDEMDSAYKRYYGAWDHFRTQGGKDRIVFFLMTHLSLKYGLLDDGDYMNVVPTPQDIYVYLCDNLSTYEDRLKKLMSSTPGPIDISLEGLELPAETVSIIYALSILMDSMKEDIRTLSKSVNTYHDDDIFEAEITYDESQIWNPLKAISSKIENEIPIFRTKYFIPLLIADHRFYIHIIFNYLPKLMADVKFNGVFSNISNIQTDNYFLELVDDVDELLRSGFSHCCRNHSTDKVSKFEIMFCESQDGLKNRFKRVFERELSEVFV